MRVIIAGSRTFTNVDELLSKVDSALSDQKPEDVVIISGGAGGADDLAYQYARKRQLKFEMFPARWDAHGKMAGFLRNIEMAKSADACIIFNENGSKGSTHMEEQARKHGLKLKVYRYNTNDTTGAGHW